MTTLNLFPTPAPRGGVPLMLSNITYHIRRLGFQPLRRGAVFLCSCTWAPAPSRVCVSNPCAAGRCSSALYHPQYRAVLTAVSNPCAAGRCSSEERANAMKHDPRAFPTPAPRGGVPLHDRYADQWVEPGCFQPLRRGAVFLCRKCAVARAGTRGVSNPCAAGRCSSALKG